MTDSNAEVSTFRATLDGEEVEVEVLPGEPLLDCMLAEGLDPPFQCMEAKCGTCMVLLKRGEVSMHRDDVLSQRDREQGYVLLCQSVPLTPDVWVDCDV